ncbi:MAG: hypothetical protein U1E91_02165 [Moraxella sp.]
MNIQIVGVISNKADAYALERIRLANEQQANIATAVIAWAQAIMAKIYPCRF